jgi:hypothetical protein
MAHLLKAVTLVIALAAASAAQAADPVFPLGSRIGVVPPTGMVPSTTFQGFEDADRNVALILSELPPDAFPAMEKAFTLDSLKSKGIDAERRDDVSLKDGQGFIVVTHQEAAGVSLHKWALIAKTGELTAIATMQVPDAAAQTYPDEACRTALASLTVRTVPQKEQMALLPYDLRDLAGFRLVRSLPDGTALLTEGPKDAVGSSDQPYMLIAIPPVATPQPEERPAFARKLLVATPGIKEIRITRSEPLRIGGQPGYEVLAEAKEDANATPVTLVQWMRFGPGRFLHIFGLARSDAWPGLYPRMRAVRDGIEPK